MLLDSAKIGNFEKCVGIFYHMILKVKDSRIHGGKDLFLLTEYAESLRVG